MKISSLSYICLGLLLTLPLPAATIHVPGDQPTIQAGIDAAVDGDTVLVADGIYTGEGNRDLFFLGRAITVRSENGAANCIIDCQGSAEVAHRGFSIQGGEDENSVVQGFTIQNGHAGSSSHGGGIFCNHASPTIRNNIISGNSCGFYGGGICCLNASPIIEGNTITSNLANWGGGISCRESEATIRNNTISENTVEQTGGGVFCDFNCSVTLFNNLISENVANWHGGGISCYMSSSLTLSNCTIVSNDGTANSGGIYCSNSTVLVDSSILWGNVPEELGFASGGTGVVTYSDIQGGWTGEGNIDADPLFVTGPLGEHYLSQVVCGDPDDSPCLDSGIQSTEPYGTTGCLWDTGVVDMGYHYPVLGIIAGPGPDSDHPPLVRVFPLQQDASHVYQFSAYGPQHFGVNVSCGDLAGDDTTQILTGAGPGPIFGPHVRGFRVDGTPLDGLSYLAYGTNKWGVNVAAGDLDGDGFDEIITGAGPGAVFGPHVRGWNYDGGPLVTPMSAVSYFAYGTPKWGVNVSSGDIDGDGYDEIVTGPGPGAVYGPHVRGWDVDDGEATANPSVSFLAYGTNKFGVNVSCGDVDGDGIDEIVTGAGPGAVFGPHVRGWNCDGGTVTPLTGLSFFAWDTEPLRFGANVFAGADLNGDGRDEMVVGRGPDPDADTEVKVFTYDGMTVSQWISLEAFPGLTNGTNVAAGLF